MKIDGKLIASEILDSLKSQVDSLKSQSITPTLAIILIGNDESSKSYIKQKQLKAEEIGAEIKLFQFDSTSEEKLIELITQLNNDKLIHGIIVQRPLPSDFDRNKISELINPEKDVDGFNTNSNFDAPVALAVLEIFKKFNIDDFSNKKIVVIGKGETAGRPIIKLLNKENVTPVVIDKNSSNPTKTIQEADIIISAVGKENIIKPENLNTKQILIGVGLFMKEGKLKGDYDESEVENKVKMYTPTIGGVGPVNVACLMKNLVFATETLN